MPDKKKKLMKKPMCKLKKKLLDDDIDTYAGLVDEPGFLCKKCGRVANNKKNICKPYELGE